MPVTISDPFRTPDRDPSPRRRPQPVAGPADAARYAAVRGRLAGDRALDAVGSAAQRRLAAVHTGEDGAQAAEYAMLGGVGAAIVGALITFFTKTDLLEKIFAAVVEAVIESIRSWF